jgi:hypothetical protein
MGDEILTADKFKENMKEQPFIHSYSYNHIKEIYEGMKEKSRNYDGIFTFEMPFNEDIREDIINFFKSKGYIVQKLEYNNKIECIISWDKDHFCWYIEKMIEDSPSPINLKYRELYNNFLSGKI